jgi:hypothetical protein
MQGGWPPKSRSACEAGGMEVERWHESQNLHREAIQWQKALQILLKLWSLHIVTKSGKNFIWL